LGPLGIPVVELADPEAVAIRESDMARVAVWVDALLGTGLKSEVTGLFAHVIELVNRMQKPVVAVDIPSGLCADTGKPMGCCLRATVTVTFAFPKIGHFLYPGAEYTGELDVVDIGIPPHIVRSVNPGQEVVTEADIQKIYRPRPAETHKGNAGHLVILAGSTGKAGAAVLSGLGAVRTGAGLVTFAAPMGIVPILQNQVVEAMALSMPETPDGFLADAADAPWEEAIRGKNCLAVGPGIGTHPETVRLIHRILAESSRPVVIDADGLNCLSQQPDILGKARGPVILTPHPGEMARLMDGTVAEVQSDRIGTARRFSTRHGVFLVLKGAVTIVAVPDGKVYVNPTANPGMASGGMGDVLTGVIGALVAQGYSPQEACRMGVFLHGQAAENRRTSDGPQGFSASDVANEIPRVFRRLHEYRIV
jgi:NAD(P)H-hydrate epimerase